MGDVCQPIQPVGLDWREQPLVLAASERSPSNPDHCTDIPEVTAEHPRERFEGSVRQAMPNGGDEVLALRNRPQDFATTQ